MKWVAQGDAVGLEHFVQNSQQQDRVAEQPQHRIQLYLKSSFAGKQSIKGKTRIQGPEWKEETDRSNQRLGILDVLLWGPS